MDKPIDRHAARIRDEAAGPFALLAERNHPLVRILSDYTYRSFRKWTIFCVAVPLAVLAAVLVIAGLEGWGPHASDVLSGLPPPQLTLWSTKGVGLFLVVWPGICIMGAALSAAGTVSSERARESALQLVLTPLPMRPIAASKILPAVWPFLWGVVAALPLYCLAGGAEPFFIHDRHMGMMMPSVAWPVRIFTLFYLDYEQLRPSLLGAATGLTMAATDAGLVWAAAHWGAAMAVRWKGLLVAVVAELAGRLVIAFGVVLGFWMGSFGVLYMMGESLTFFVPEDRVPWVLLVPVHAAGLLAVWYVWPVRGAARRALAEFAFFDRLADDERMPSRQRRFAGHRWWEVNWRQ